MNIEQNNLAFKSKIIFVSPRFYNHKVEEFSKNPECENISHWDIVPWREGKKYFGYRKDVDTGYTKNVRSCTSGLFVNKGEKAPLFMHIENTIENTKNADKLKEFFQGTNAILIGAKNEFLYSKQLFSKFREMAVRKNFPLTIMQTMDIKWQTSLAYSSNEDTLFLCVNNIRKKSEYIKNAKKLNQIFKTVQISKTDSIEFLSKSKELSLMISFAFENFKRAINLLHKK